MTRPPFPITEKTNQLRLVKSAPSASIEKAKPPQEPALVRGVGYPVSSFKLIPDHGLVGGLAFLVDGSNMTAAESSQTAFIWDADADIDEKISVNEFQLLNCSLEGPEIFTGVSSNWLSIKPKFHFYYHTTGHAAYLAEICLVESQRSFLFEDGSTQTMLDTQERSVLYLENNLDNCILRQQTPWQPWGVNSEYHFDYRIAQELPDSFNGKKVANVTVLEQFTSYFMERPLTNEKTPSIWVPVFAPVSWGWSMRVEQATEGWNIVRRKLMPPVVGHDGWQLPKWSSNTLECK